MIIWDGTCPPRLNPHDRTLHDVEMLIPECREDYRYLRTVSGWPVWRAAVAAIERTVLRFRVSRTPRRDVRQQRVLSAAGRG